MNSQHENTNFKGDFVQKKNGLKVHFKELNLTPIKFGMTNLINNHLSLTFPTHKTQVFNLDRMILINCIHQIKSESKIYIKI